MSVRAHPPIAGGKHSNGLDGDPSDGATSCGGAPISAVDTVYRTRQVRSIVDLLSNNNTAKRSLIFGLPKTSGRVP